MKVLLADDHQLFLEGMRAVLTTGQSDIEIMTTTTGPDTLASLSATSYDVALIDLRLPGLDGFSLLKELTRIQCLTPIIMVTASEDPRDEQEALTLGAMGYVSKSSSGKEIRDAIRSVQEGNEVRPETNPRGNKHSQGDWASQHNITPRQLEVLRLVRNGLSNQAIADDLCLSTATVKTHIVAIFAALGTQSRTESIQKAHQLGLD